MDNMDLLYSFMINKEEDIVTAIEITDEISKNLGFEEKDQLFLRLVTEEACVNAYENVSSLEEKSIYMDWCKYDNYFGIKIWHVGKTFQPKSYQGVNIGPRGRGLHLIVSLMDRVRVEQEGEYVILYMGKKLVKREHKGEVTYGV
jgi:serine/threonine-protein kinase RsbW